MKGYQLTFFTSQGARHGHAALCDWVLETARDCGASGGTVVSGQEALATQGCCIQRVFSNWPTNH